MKIYKCRDAARNSEAGGRALRCNLGETRAAQITQINDIFYN